MSPLGDRSYNGERADKSGPTVKAALEATGYAVRNIIVVPDDQPIIEATLAKEADEFGTALVVTTGGTGFAPRDVTPEATDAICDKRVPGIPELMRTASARITSRACLSRSSAGIRKRTLFVNLPGSPKGALENLEAIICSLEHGLVMLRGEPSSCADSRDT